MPTLICSNTSCATQFYTKHSTAKYCTRRCAGTYSMRQPDVRERQRMQMRKYSDEQLLDLLIQQAEELGRTPTHREVRPSDGVYRRRFGTYRTAIILAGLTPTVTAVAGFVNPESTTIRPSVRFEILKRDGFRCQYCGSNPQQDGCTLHVDHIVPRSAGGSNEPDNLVTACFLCNNGKGDTILTEQEAVACRRSPVAKALRPQNNL